MVGSPESDNQIVFNTYLNQQSKYIVNLPSYTIFFFPSCVHFMSTGVEKADGWVHVRLGLIIRSLPLTLQCV